MKNIEQTKKIITEGNIPMFVEMYGQNPTILKSQQERYNALLDEFKTFSSFEDVMVFSSPGRTEIGGNHTDHQHGRVLAGAVNMDNIAVAAKNSSQIIRIKSSGYPEFKVDLSNLDIDESKFYTSEALVKGINAKMKEQGFEIGGFDAVIDSQVPKGSGLSSSASFEVLIGSIVSHLFNNGKLDAVENAKIGQWAENNYFGKPCGLMDQTACSVGGFITIDFENPAKPIVKALSYDFQTSGYTLVITDTGGDHADLNDEYASLPTEMKSVANIFGKEVLRESSLEEIVSNIPTLRAKTNDRAILRAIHFQRDNSRVAEQVNALEENRFNDFLNMVIQSGYSSYMYNQNIYPSNNPKEQNISIALALSDVVLNGKGAWRVHGGGFAGTIQAFVPNDLVDEYVSTLESAYGVGKCHKLFIRKHGSVRVEL